MSTQPKRHARIEVVQGGAGQWFLRLRAANGRILAHSEPYASKSNAERAVLAWARAMVDIREQSLNGMDCVFEVSP